MPLGEAGAVRSENERDVRKDRRHGIQGAVEQNLLGRIGDVVGATNYMRDSHVHVVDYGAELIGGQGGPAARAARRTEQHEIFHLIVMDFAWTENSVIKAGSCTQRHAETHRRILIGSGWLSVAARAANDSLYFTFGGASFVCGIAARVLFRRTMTEISSALGEQFFCCSSIAGEALGLIERALIPIEPQPAQAIENAFDQFRAIALEVGVLDAEDECATLISCKKPVK